jgi:hypothetical protein
MDSSNTSSSSSETGITSISSVNERIYNIQNENNTAQNQLIQYLEKMSKNIFELMIPLDLHGDIDFSILKEMNFDSIRQILFQQPQELQGEITSIHGIPEEILTVSCPNHLLTEMPELPSSLLLLDLTNNYIQYASFKNTPNLTKMNLSSNQLNEIMDLPPSLEELDIHDNKITFLDLSTLTSLRSLNVTGNKSIVLHNPPPSLVDLKIDDNPFRQQSISSESESSKEENEMNLNYIDALNRYMNLKRDYEFTILERKRQLYEKGNTKKEKRDLIKGFQPLCIKCRRPVGTIFSIKDQHYMAICGDKTEPCKLNIKLDKGLYFSSFEQSLYEFKENVEELKETIIKQKLDALFNYTNETEAVYKFKNNMEEYMNMNNVYETLFKRYKDYHNNEIRDEKIKHKMEEINKIILDIQQRIDKYKKEPENEHIIQEIVDIEIKELFPEIHNLRMLKYTIMEMDEVLNKKNVVIKNVLVQNQLGLLDYETEFTKPQVIRWNE